MHSPMNHSVLATSIAAADLVSKQHDCQKEQMSKQMPPRMSAAAAKS